MNSDHYFGIGKDHVICQDYAVRGRGGEKFAFISLSDGCSKSPETDLGARFLCLSSLRTYKVGGENMICDLFGKITIKNLETIGDYFPMHPLSMDATLLTTWVKEDVFGTFIYGDGVFFHKSATELKIVKVDFETNTPAYLSYHLDKVRLLEYNLTVKGSKHIHEISFPIVNGVINYTNSIEIENYVNPFDPVEVRGMVSQGDLLGVMSDGVNSFSRTNGTSIPWLEIVKEFIDFKSTNGVFVQRRLLAMKRNHQKEGIIHADDISMAAIFI